MEIIEAGLKSSTPGDNYHLSLSLSLWHFIMIDSLGWMISYEKIHLKSDLVVVFAGEIEIGGN